MTEWVFADAWFFESVALGPDTGVSLREVLFVGDGINRAVLSAAEINGAFNRLRAADLVDVERKRFHLTERGRAFQRRSPDGSGFDKVLWAQIELAGYPALEVSTWSLSNDEWENTYREYSAWFDARLADDDDYPTPESAALAGSPPSANARVISCTIDGDVAEVVYDTEPSWLVRSHCLREFGQWFETSFEL